ncbi:hypothetical protein AGMMS49983_15870 [Clostridia bacterium]|nr:hypothetical protein AGMMS49983_15870 [Clostridia bacterium]
MMNRTERAIEFNKSMIMQEHLDWKNEGRAEGRVEGIEIGEKRGEKRGKNIYKSLSEAAGFKVVDIGIDQPASAFVEAAKANDANIIRIEKYRIYLSSSLIIPLG